MFSAKQAFRLPETLNLPDSMDGNGVIPPTSYSAPGTSQRSEGTNVVRVAFGVRRARRTRPARPDHWATLVLPLQAGGGGVPPTPPQAA